MNPPYETPFGEVKELFLKQAEKGVICPLTGVYTKIYPRKLNSGMAKALLLIYKISNKIDFGYIHVQDEFIKYGIKKPASLEYNKLRYWGLIETRKGDNPSGANKSGYWKLTLLGISFAKGGSKVRETIIELRSQFCGFKGDEISITDAIKNKFCYFELMGFLPLNELPGGTP